MTKQEIKQLIAGNCIDDRAADDAANKLYEQINRSFVKRISIDSALHEALNSASDDLDIVSKPDFKTTQKVKVMKWIPIDPDNPPDGEVLAANFAPGTHGYSEKLLGYLYFLESSEGEKVICEDDQQLIYGCTHYIDINKHDL